MVRHRIPTIGSSSFERRATRRIEESELTSWLNSSKVGGILWAPNCGINRCNAPQSSSVTSETFPMCMHFVSAQHDLRRFDTPNFRKETKQHIIRHINQRNPNHPLWDARILQKCPNTNSAI